MDPLSISIGILTALQLSSDVLMYLIAVKGASKGRKRLHEQILACQFVLLQIQDQVHDGNEAQPLEGRYTSLHRLAAALEGIKAKLEPKKRLDEALSALTWSFTEKEVEKLISLIQQEVSLLNLELAADCRKMTRELHERQINRDNWTTLNWLTSIDYASQQANFVSRRQEGTGQWLLESAEFRRWVEGDKQMLFCPGIPGAGKTILTSIVIDRLCAMFRNDSTVGIAYLYCEFKQKDQQSPKDLVASLLRQLAEGRPCLPPNLTSLFSSHKRQNTRPSLGELSRSLRSIAATYSKVFIIVDALDECQEANGCRARLLSELISLREKCGANIFATSRFTPEIARHFEGDMTLEIRAHDQDVRRYLDSHMAYLPSFVQRRLDMREEIKTAIVDAVDGMFLLAKLHLESLIGKKSPKAVRDALRKLPTGSNAYDDAYRDAMGRIEAQMPDQIELAKQALLWIVCAKRQLTTSELVHALATEVGEAELDQENIPEIEDIVSVSAGLITLDEESSIIRLVHYTAQDFFERTQKQWFPNSEADIAATCTTYLSFGIFDVGFCRTDKEFEENLRSNPLYGYASHNWGHHARAAPTESKKIILDFLQNDLKVSRCSQAMMAATDCQHGYSQAVPQQFTAVHLGAYFGLRDIVATLLENGNTSDLKDTYGRTPLSYAAERGYDDVVMLLLTGDSVNPNLKDFALGWTPLWYAVTSGHLNAVKLLLKMEVVDPDAQSKYGSTPLSWTAEKGCEAMAKLLLRDDRVNPNSKDARHGWTPLLWAAARGNVTVVKLLLDTPGVDPNSKDLEYGRTPLSWAAERGYKDVVQVLLAKHCVDSHSRSKYGRTSLWFARERGHEAIVKLFLADASVDPGLEPSQHEQMPLWYAAETGKEELVKVLLESGVDPNMESSHGRTPLSYAAERGHEGVTKLLLETKSVDHDNKDSEYERTPLSWAAAAGHLAVVKLLLERGSIDPDSKSRNGRTPLSWAARFGHETVVELLLTKGEVNPDSKCDYGRTPLSYAAERGHEGVVRLLIGREGVNLSSKDCECGRTPLSWAAENGHGNIVVLLSKKAGAL